MAQFARPTPAALDYDSTILGALELREKKWMLAVQLPRGKRHTRHVLGASGEELMASAAISELRSITAVLHFSDSMKRLAVIVTSLLFAAPALALSVGEKSGVNSALAASPSMADFVKEAAISDIIQSSQLALSRRLSRPKPLPRR